MRSNVLLKAVIVGGVAIAFLAPLAMILGIVKERSRYRESVAAEVARSTAESQILMGPIVVVRYRERIATGVPGGVEFRDDAAKLLPDTLSVRSRAHVETRKRGIYRVPVFRASNAFSARFNLPQGLGIPADRVGRLAGEPTTELVFGVADPRGIRGVPRVSVNGVTAEAKPGAGLEGFENGFRVPLPAGAPGRALNVEVSLEIVGTDRLMFLPIGAITDVAVSSDWPHPSFSGSFLPDERRIDAQGFQAHWKLSRFATGIDEAMKGRIPIRASVPNRPGFDLGVRFVQPVDVYTQSERAVKYGFLFVFLTFVAFFLFEVLRRMAVHPIQYVLCGAALALFFLLLVSLSEHLPFVAAYVTASAACIALVSFYVGHVLRRASRGFAFAGLLGALYAFLYVLLQSEDYALLLGTILLFGALAAVMVMTRRVDWYRLSEETTTAR